VVSPLLRGKTCEKEEKMEETVKTPVKMEEAMKNPVKTGGKAQNPAKMAETKPQFLFELKTENPLQLTANLAREHTLRFIVPSLHFHRAPVVGWKVNTPNLLVEMDENIIMNVEGLCLQILSGDRRLDAHRKEHKELHGKTNKYL
jgi:hypothetical protein